MLLWNQNNTLTGVSVASLAKHYDGALAFFSHVDGTDTRAFRFDVDCCIHFPVP
jgi:hypothetical protein